MRNADETVHKLLMGLRDAEPGEGMEQRILTAVQLALEPREGFQSPGSPVFWPRWSRQALAMLVAVAAVLTMGWLLVFNGRPHRKTLADVGSHTIAAEARQKSKTIQVTPKPAGHASHAVSAAAMSRAQNHPSSKNLVRSYPAPPLPLTEQERLLLRLARSRDPGDLAVLNYDVRRAQAAQAKEQFRQFFGMNDQEMRTQLE